MGIPESPPSRSGWCPVPAHQHIIGTLPVQDRSCQLRLIGDRVPALDSTHPVWFAQKVVTGA